MKQKIKHFLCSGGQGSTLIEEIVSVALFAILSLMVVSALSVSLFALRSSHKSAIDANTAAGNVEDKRAKKLTTNGSPYSIIIDGKSIAGKCVPSDTTGKVTYYEFVPN